MERFSGRSIMARRPRTARPRPRRRPARVPPPGCTASRTGTELSPEAPMPRAPPGAVWLGDGQDERARRDHASRSALRGRGEHVDAHAGREQPGDRGIGEPDGRDDGAGGTAHLVVGEQPGEHRDARRERDRRRRADDASRGPRRAPSGATATGSRTTRTSALVSEVPAGIDRAATTTGEVGGSGGSQRLDRAGGGETEEQRGHREPGAPEPDAQGDGERAAAVVGRGGGRPVSWWGRMTADGRRRRRRRTGRRACRWTVQPRARLRAAHEAAARAARHDESGAPTRR